MMELFSEMKLHVNIDLKILETINEFGGKDVPISQSYAVAHTDKGSQAVSYFDWLQLS
jgi:hypothetical protein